MTSNDLESLTGIGPTTAQALRAAGFPDAQSLAGATVEELVAIRGFADSRATSVIAEARAHSSAPDQPSVVNEGGPPKSAQTSMAKSDAKKRKKLRARHADFKRRAKRARKKSKSASSKKKRKRWASEAERLSKKAKKAKRQLSRLD